MNDSATTTQVIGLGDGRKTLLVDALRAATAGRPYTERWYWPRLRSPTDAAHDEAPPRRYAPSGRHR